MIRHILAACALMFSVGTALAQETAKLADIVMTFGDVTVTAELADTPPSRDLLAQLPLTVKMSRLIEREYAGRHPLSTEGTRQEGFTLGDVGYWTPGGYLAVFFAEGTRSDISDLIVMGRLTSDLSVFNDMGQGVEVTITRADGG